MMMRSKTILAVLGALLSATAACGPTKLAVSPDQVVNTVVRPASGQLLFCPGDPFLVEVVTKMKDGTQCSTRDDKSGCMGQEGVLDPSLVRLSASSGRPKGKPSELVWFPDPNPLTTAGTGLELRAQIGSTETPTTVATAALRPVYQCRMSGRFDAPPAMAYGQHGMTPPDLVVAVTTFSTPFYPDAALVRVTSGTRVEYFISPSADQPLRITGRGQDGGQGQPGVDGQDGQSGTDAPMSASCQPGTPGTDGTDGQAGGPGGDAGPAPRVIVVLDAAAADKLRSRVLVESFPGNPGGPGPGGDGGRGGSGGWGRGGTECEHNGVQAPSGRDGRTGPAGTPGRPAAPTPPPTFESQAREALFSGELGTIVAVEATQAK